MLNVLKLTNSSSFNKCINNLHIFDFIYITDLNIIRYFVESNFMKTNI